ncbi:fimbria/pilus outer membrane usher protein [Dryocola boscaweniae]
MKKQTLINSHGYSLLHTPSPGTALLLATMPTALMLMSHSRLALADDYFDPAALEFSDRQQKTADLHYFSKAGGQQPGAYQVSVVVNDQQVSQQTVEFTEDDGILKPVLTPAQLAEFGVNVSAFSSFNQLHEGESFTRIERYIPDASSKFDFIGQRLVLSIPQAAMNVQSRGYVDPARWDDGIAAAFVNYSLTGSQTHQQEGVINSNYLNLRSGINLGGWRLRNISSLMYDKHSRWQSQSTYLQHDIKSLRSLFRAGDTYTTGDVFDSIQFRGVQLMSEDEMLPDSQRGFAPVIRGMAHSNAKVTVSQHGYVIYETYVAPGAFALKDLYPTAQSGDLEVKITESNGSVRTFTQPFSAVPFMLREGRSKFSVSAGRYRSGLNQSRTPQFVQSTLFYGLPASFTASGGAQLAQQYQAYALGISRGFGELGSLGSDVTFSTTSSPSGKRYIGRSVRAQYQKDFNLTGTSISLASYRYSSSGYYDFSEAVALEGDNSLVDNKRSREEFSVSQSLGGWGSLSASIYSQEYWHSQGHDETLHIGLYSGWKGISCGLGYYYTKSSTKNEADRSLSLNVNIPLGQWLSENSVSYNMTSDNTGHTSQQVSLYGSLLENHNLYYNVQQGYGNKGQGANSGVGFDYHGGYGTTQLGYRYDNRNKQLTWGASGSIVAHAHGVTFGQTTSDSFAIVRAPGASHVAIQNGSNIHTDSRGYAVVPALTNWRKNDITLDTSTMDGETDVELESQTVIPGGGAVVLANYQTHIGYRVLFALRDNNGPLPFGASAHLIAQSEDDGKPASGMVADRGEVYLSGIPDEGTIEASWDEQNVTRRCVTHFSIPPAQQHNQIKTVDGICL